MKVSVNNFKILRRIKAFKGGQGVKEFNCDKNNQGKDNNLGKLVCNKNSLNQKFRKNITFYIYEFF